MAENRRLRWEPPVSITDDAETVMAQEDKFGEIVSKIGGSATAVATSFFLAGWALAEQGGRQALQEVLGGNARTTARFLASKKKKTFLDQLKYIYDNDYDGNDDEGFITTCIEDGVPPEIYNKIIKQSKRVLDPALDWKPVMIRWLDAGIMSDGVPHDCDTIQEVAKEDGIVKDEKDWQRLRSVASERGFTTGVKGYWKKP